MQPITLIVRSCRTNTLTSLPLTLPDGEVDTSTACALVDEHLVARLCVEVCRIARRQDFAITHEPEELVFRMRRAVAAWRRKEPAYVHLSVV